MQKITTPNTKRITYTVEELARAIGIGRSAAYKALANGQIPALRIGKRYVVPRVAIDEWLKAAKSL